VVYCLRVEPAKIIGFGIGVAERLEVDDELIGVESLSDIVDALANLILDRIRFDGRGRTK
jgi:hypothetical protein